MLKYWMCIFLLPLSLYAQETTAPDHELYFAPTKAELSDSAQQVLLTFVEEAQSQPSQPIQLYAHTDDVGSLAENRALSTRRAKAVQQFLIAEGIAPNRIQQKALGETLPAVPNTTAANRRRNRRVELRLLQPEAGRLSVEIRDAQSKAPLSGTLYLSENGERYPITIDSSGSFSTRFKAGTEGKAEVEVEGYAPATKTWMVASADTSKLLFEMAKKNENEQVLSIRVSSAKTEEPLPAQVILLVQEQEIRLKIDESGVLNIPLEGRLSGRAEVEHEGYFYASRNWMMQDADTTYLDFMLQAAEQDAVLELEIFFYGGVARILPKSRPELDRLKRFVEQNSNLSLEIAGHVNVPNMPPVPRNSSHFRLSEERAAVVKDFLIRQGVDASRITARGYGNSEMIYPRAKSESEQARNRRVEVRIIGTR